MVTDSPAAARDFFASQPLRPVTRGSWPRRVDGLYEAGERSRNWLKIKRVHTLDLVILAAEWGHGRRRGWLSNLHLGARDPSDGSFVMLGKTFKGLTDAMLMEQTALLQRLETARDRHTVYVQPEVVVEVAFNDLQASPQYPAGCSPARCDSPASSGTGPTRFASGTGGHVSRGVGRVMTSKARDAVFGDGGDAEAVDGCRCGG